MIERRGFQKIIDDFSFWPIARHDQQLRNSVAALYYIVFYPMIKKQNFDLPAIVRVDYAGHGIDSVLSRHSRSWPNQPGFIRINLYRDARRYYDKIASAWDDIVPIGIKVHPCTAVGCVGRGDGGIREQLDFHFISSPAY